MSRSPQESVIAPSSPSGVSRSPRRLAYLDWLRGLAALIMLQGHAFHSFTAPEWRDSALYQLSQFVGGMPPALFLFLTGITMAFLLDSAERKGLTLGRRWRLALRRAGYLFGLAYIFRVQLWLFGQPSSPWTDLFKVDILNCMGLALMVMASLTIFSTAARARLAAVAGVAIAALSPLVSSLDWTGVPSGLRNYVAPDYNSFSFFPWAAFLAFGICAGSVIRITRPEKMGRVMQWVALGGFGLILSGQYFSRIPYSIYARSDFWLDSPALTFIKLGVIFLGMAFAFLWTKYVIGERWNWLCQLGTTSLLVYWLHVELVYGRWFWWWKENLSLGQAAVSAVAVIVLMLGVSVVRTNWTQIRAWLARPLFPVASEETE